MLNHLVHTLLTKRRILKKTNPERILLKDEEDSLHSPQPRENVHINKEEHLLI